MIKLRRKYLEWRLKNLESDYKYAKERKRELTDGYDPVTTAEYIIWCDMTAKKIRKIKSKLKEAKCKTR